MNNIGMFNACIINRYPQRYYPMRLPTVGSHIENLILKEINTISVIIITSLKSWYKTDTYALQPYNIVEGHSE